MNIYFGRTTNAMIAIRASCVSVGILLTVRVSFVFVIIWAQAIQRFNIVWPFDCRCRARHNWSRENSAINVRIQDHSFLKNILIVRKVDWECVIEDTNCDASNREIVMHQKFCHTLSRYQVCACLGPSLKMMNWNGVDDTRSTRYLTTGVTKPIYEMKHRKTVTCLLTLLQNTPIQTIYQKTEFHLLFVRLHCCSSCAFQNSDPSKNRRRKKNWRTNAHRRNRRWERRNEKKKIEENLLWISSAGTLRMRC